VSQPRSLVFICHQRSVLRCRISCRNERHVTSVGQATTLHGWVRYKLFLDILLLTSLHLRFPTNNLLWIVLSCQKTDNCWRNKGNICASLFTRRLLCCWQIRNIFSKGGCHLTWPLLLRIYLSFRIFSVLLHQAACWRFTSTCFCSCVIDLREKIFVNITFASGIICYHDSPDIACCATFRVVSCVTSKVMTRLDRKIGCHGHGSILTSQLHEYIAHRILPVPSSAHAIRFSDISRVVWPWDYRSQTNCCVFAPKSNDTNLFLFATFKITKKHHKYWSFEGVFLDFCGFPFSTCLMLFMTVSFLSHDIIRQRQQKLHIGWQRRAPSWPERSCFLVRYDSEVSVSFVLKFWARSGHGLAKARQKYFAPSSSWLLSPVSHIASEFFCTTQCLRWIAKQSKSAATEAR